jgi:hypothetical protein
MGCQLRVSGGIHLGSSLSLPSFARLGSRMSVSSLTAIDTIFHVPKLSSGGKAYVSSSLNHPENKGCLSLCLFHLILPSLELLEKQMASLVRKLAKANHNGVMRTYGSAK